MAAATKPGRVTVRDWRLRIEPLLVNLAPRCARDDAMCRVSFPRWADLLRAAGLPRPETPRGKGKRPTDHDDDEDDRSRERQAAIDRRPGRSKGRGDAEGRLADAEESGPLEDPGEDALPEEDVDEPDDQGPRRQTPA